MAGITRRMEWPEPRDLTSLEKLSEYATLLYQHLTEESALRPRDISTQFAYTTTENIGGPEISTLGTAKIDDIAITTAKIKDAAVEADKIAEGAVEEAKIALSAVTETKIAADAVTATKINVVGLGGESGRIVVADATDADVVTGGVNSYATTLIQAGKIVISGEVNLDDWRMTGHLTYIDGGNIYTESITANEIKVNTLTLNRLETALDNSLYGLTVANNVGIGTGALASITDGIGNIAFGQSALASVTDGMNDIGIGFEALTACTGGDGNLVIGYTAGHDITIANENIAIGDYALALNTKGSGNVALGWSALAAYNYTASDANTMNVAIGAGTGGSLVIGTGNVFLGYQSGGTETGSNTLYIANSNTATPLIGGVFPNTSLTFTSDASTFSGTIASADITVDSKLVLSAGSITDGDGVISFGDENLSTTGTLASGALTVTNTATIKKATGDSILYIDTYNTAPADYSQILLRTSDTDTIDTLSETQNGDTLGKLAFQGVDDASSFQAGALITAVQNGAAGTGEVPTDLVFETFSATALNTDQLVLHHDGGVLMPNLKSGINQVGAGAATGELWVDTDDDNTIKLGA